MNEIEQEKVQEMYENAVMGPRRVLLREFKDMTSRQIQQIEFYQEQIEKRHKRYVIEENEQMQKHAAIMLTDLTRHYEELIELKNSLDMLWSLK